MTKRGAVVPLAWPNAMANTSYPKMDKYFRIINLSKQGYYKVGHAALLLLFPNGTVKYYDFGRYIAPDGMGRIRGANTDPELHFPLKVEFKAGKVSNLKEILIELKQNKYTHGIGPMYAGVHYIPDVFKAEAYIHQEQKRNLIPYGAFEPKGTNCSRFVAQTIAHCEKSTKKMLFLYPYYLTPSPLGNIFNSNGNEALKVDDQLNYNTLNFTSKLDQARYLKRKVFFNAKDEIPESKIKAHRYAFDPPLKNKIIPDNAQWLGGVGYGAWYAVKPIGTDEIYVERFQADGHLDFACNFHLSDPSLALSPQNSFKILHGSHFQNIILEQNKQTLVFIKKEA